MIKHLLLITSLFFTQTLIAQKIIPVGVPNDRKKPPYEVVGKVYDGGTGEPLPGANVYIERQNIGTSADLEGNFTLKLYSGLYLVQASYAGYEVRVKRINVLGDGKLTSC